MNQHYLLSFFYSFSYFHCYVWVCLGISTFSSLPFVVFCFLFSSLFVVHIWKSLFNFGIVYHVSIHLEKLLDVHNQFRQSLYIILYIPKHKKTFYSIHFYWLWCARCMGMFARSFFQLCCCFFQRKREKPW